MAKTRNAIEYWVELWSKLWCNLMNMHSFIKPFETQSTVEFVLNTHTHTTTFSMFIVLYGQLWVS